MLKSKQADSNVITDINALKALEIWEVVGGASDLVLGYQGLAIICYYKKDYKKAAFYWEKELQIEKQKQLEGIGGTLGN